MKKSDVFKHYILTRFNTQIIDGLLYDKPDANDWMERRMDLFEATKESVLSQDADFEWVISLDKRTPKKFVEKIKAKNVTLVDCDIRQAFTQVKTTTPWVITSRLDNDDLYRPGAIQKIQDWFEQKIEVIDIDYQQLDLKTGNKYTSERKTPNSPFLSLVEPSRRIMTCFCRPHTKLPMGYPFKDGNAMIRAVKINEILAYMVIHDNNVANKIVGKEIL